MEAVERSSSARLSELGPTRGELRWKAWTQRAIMTIAVSATTFAIYALTVSAVGAPPSVHAAGLLLWVAHVVMLFGRVPGPMPRQRTSSKSELDRDAFERAMDVAAALSVERRDDPPRRR